MPKLISLVDKTRTRYRSRLVLRQHFPLMLPLVAVFFHRVFPLQSHILVITDASDYTWLEHLSKEGGLIPRTLDHAASRLLSSHIHKIRFPACSHCHITPRPMCGFSLQSYTAHAGSQLSLIDLHAHHIAMTAMRQGLGRRSSWRWLLCRSGRPGLAMGLVMRLSLTAPADVKPCVFFLAWA